MADKKISQLTAASLPLAGTEVLPIVQSSTTKKVAAADVIAGVTVSSGFSTTITGGGTVYVGASNSYGDLALLKNAVGTTKVGVSNSDGTANSGATFSSYYGGTEIAAFGHYWDGGAFINRIKYFANQEFAEGTTVRVRIAQTSGNLTAVTGNFVVGTAGKGITTGSATALGFGVNNSTTDMTLDASGNLLVGNTTQILYVNKELNVNAASGSAGFALATGGTARLYMTAGSTNGNITTKGAIPLLLGTNETTRARVDASGNFLIAKTDADFAAVGFEYLASGTILRNTASGGVAVQLNRLASDGDIVGFFRDTASVGSISVTTTATAYNTSSDARLKHDIVDAPDAAGLIDAIKVRSFKWNADNSEQRFGVVAQELLPIAPEAVTVPSDENDMMSVDYSKLVPMLVKEIQSLRVRVAQLEGK